MQAAGDGLELGHLPRVVLLRLLRVLDGLLDAVAARQRALRLPHLRAVTMTDQGLGWLVGWLQL